MPSSERLKLLRFAASFVWADLDLADSERAFLRDLADELDVPGAEAQALLDGPPAAEDVDPCRVRPALADRVRDVALRAIAADGKVLAKEMRMFDLLDELLPR